MPPLPRPPIVDCRTNPEAYGMNDLKRETFSVFIRKLKRDSSFKMLEMPNFFRAKKSSERNADELGKHLSVDKHSTAATKSFLINCQ